MSDVSKRAGRTRANWLWLAAYVVTIGAVVLAVVVARRATLNELSTPEAQAEWQAWRDAEAKRGDTGPVRRRPPSAAEPPALILMRDYFGVMMAAAVTFGSLLFGVIMVALRGAFSTGGGFTANTNPKRGWHC